VDGIAVDRVVGFEDLGSKDEFPTLVLARRLIKSGAMKAQSKEEQGRIKINKKSKKDEESDSDY